MEQENKYDFNDYVNSVNDINIIQNSFIVIASRRASGKSVLVKNIIKFSSSARPFSDEN